MIEKIALSKVFDKSGNIDINLVLELIKKINEIIDFIKKDNVNEIYRLSKVFAEVHIGDGDDLGVMARQLWHLLETKD